MSSARRRQWLRWLGRAYLAYHAVALIVLLALFFLDTRVDYWRTPDALGDLLATVLVFPLFIPALVVSGGPHLAGGGVLRVAASAVFLITLLAAGSGVWLAICRMRRLRRAAG
jgi:hypothetical protein